MRATHLTSPFFFLEFRHHRSKESRDLSQSRQCGGIPGDTCGPSVVHMSWSYCKTRSRWRRLWHRWRLWIIDELQQIRHLIVDVYLLHLRRTVGFISEDWKTQKSVLWAKMESTSCHFDGSNTIWANHLDCSLNSQTGSPAVLHHQLGSDISSWSLAGW